jgi:uncharacterized protein
LGRVLLNEPDRPAIERALEGVEEVVSSRLLWVELRRLAGRMEDLADGSGDPPQVLPVAEEILSGVTAIPLEERYILAEAASIHPMSVATLDAIHLTTAVWLAEEDVLDTVMTYDKKLAEGAREHGLSVLAPS